MPDATQRPQPVISDVANDNDYFRRWLCSSDRLSDTFAWRHAVQLPRKCLFGELTDRHSSKQLRLAARHGLAAIHYEVGDASSRRVSHSHQMTS